jgi:hypothetical protein
VETRVELVKTVYGRAGTGVHKASSSPYLLTGFLKCGLCTANMNIVAGKGKLTLRRYYGCSQSFNRGACSNRLTIRQDVIERSLFAELRTSVLKPEDIDYTLAEFIRRNRENSSKNSGKLAALIVRKQAVEQELSRLAEAVAQNGHSRFLLKAIAERERELDRIAGNLESAGPGHLSGLRATFAVSSWTASRTYLAC